ncbi:MAG TPA: FAD-dependent oxidoreductase [Myxococcota bacterium]|nr:FAD-dependent oxidoreductase [Myxococcota bacterium]HRY91940.1 FAD-dependent oxidoreductase [Myxococcota bacterium]HSA21986.1 FAD-dependent oxidoreductase [Myxococcota bacterium]
MSAPDSPHDSLQFAAIVAHQLKSPVVAVSSLLQVLLDESLGGLSARQRDLLWRAQGRCGEALAAARRLLELARPTPSGQVPEIVDVAQVAERFAVPFRSQAAEREIAFSAELQGPARAAMREAALVEVLSALVSNAIKYTPPRGKVRLRALLQGREVLVQVDDSGVGVPEAERERIFLPFVRSALAVASARPGVGLGLFFVKAVVEEAGGTVAVERGELGGACFSVRLPAQASAPAAVAAPAGLRVVIVGGAAAGPKVASRLCRLKPDAQVTILERGRHLAFTGCGLPYYVSGVVADRKELMSTAAGALRDPVFFHDVKHVQVRPRTEALEIDRAGKRVRVRDLASGEEDWLPYDALVLATGARARRLDVPGVELPGIYSLHGPDDADGIRRALGEGRALDVAVVGGGLLGVEVTEALAAKGCRVTIVELARRILGMLDEEMARLVERQFEAHGVRVLTQTEVRGFAGRGRVERVLLGDGELRADLVILSAGVEPNVDLARAAGLALGPFGGLRVDAQMRTSDPSVFAAGDCVETPHLMLAEPRFMPMGSTANRQGRVLAGVLCGREDTYPGSLATAICRVFDWCVARTGLTEAEARAERRAVVTALVPGPDRASYLPDSQPLYLKLVVDARSRRLLGAQAVGPGRGDKRVDVAATAIALGASVDHLAHLDLAYAPPYSEALDNLITAANVVRNKLDGLLRGISPLELQERLERGEPLCLLDVRSPAEYERERLPGSTLIPLGALRGRLHELPRDRDIVAFCNLSLRGYEAQIILRAAGFERVWVLDGGLAMWPFDKAY